MESTFNNSGLLGSVLCFPTLMATSTRWLRTAKVVLPKPVKTITIRYRISAISGNPTFQFVDHSGGGGLPPNFRPRIATSFLADRYWPSGVNCAFIELTDDEQVYTVRCAPNLWQDVYGGSNPKGFTSTLKKNGLWVISFGGGNNFEHGVFCSGGSAKFELLNFNIAGATQ